MTIVHIGVGVKSYESGKFETSKRTCLGSTIASLLISASFGAGAKKGTQRPFFDKWLEIIYTV